MDITRFVPSCKFVSHIQARKSADISYQLGTLVLATEVATLGVDTLYPLLRAFELSRPIPTKPSLHLTSKVDLIGPITATMTDEAK